MKNFGYARLTGMTSGDGDEGLIYAARSTEDAPGLDPHVTRS
jgi:hypothetical protein